MNVGVPLNREDSVGDAVLDSLRNTEDALRYVVNVTFDHVYMISLNHDLYYEVKDWCELLQYVMERGQTPLEFQNLLHSVVAKSSITHPSPHRPRAIELDEDKNPITQHPRQDTAVSFVYANCSILHFDEKS